MNNLDQLMSHARKYATGRMRERGVVPPTLFLASAEGLGIYIPQSFTDDQDKNLFALAAKLFGIALGATATVMVCEAWMDLPDPDPPGLLRRKEVVLLSGEVRGLVRHVYLPIVRTDAGAFFGFAEAIMRETKQMTGRFAQMLPVQDPELADRQMAIDMLGRRGLVIVRKEGCCRLLTSGSELN